MDGETFKRPVLILTDPLSSRVFFSAGIVKRLIKGLAGRLTIMTTFDVSVHEDVQNWLRMEQGVEVVSYFDVLDSIELNRVNRLKRYIDQTIDAKFGFFPLAVRHSLQHGFSLQRMKYGHHNSFLNLSLSQPFPKSKRMMNVMASWLFGKSRFIHPGLSLFLHEKCSSLIVSNLQIHAVQLMLNAATRLNIDVIGHIGSWDHPVGKGVVYPNCRTYIVQNQYMKNALINYHGIEAQKITISGWPQLDVCEKRQKKLKFNNLLSNVGLNPKLPTVLFCGNTESNAPYEKNYINRLIEWRASETTTEFNLIIRPHPRYLLNNRWKEYYRFIPKSAGLYLQTPSYGDIEVLALLLQHVDVVMTNAGTVLLDSIANNRPVICILYDHDAPAGSRYALDSVVGDHYNGLMRSNAFYQASDFEQSVNLLHHALDHPNELKSKREEITRETIGDIDGKAGSRVATAIFENL